MTRRSHRSTLARRLADATNLTYQQALSRVTSAAEAGTLPRKLDAEGMDSALTYLMTQTEAAPPARCQEHTKVASRLLDRLIEGPATDLHVSWTPGAALVASERVAAYVKPVALPALTADQADAAFYELLRAIGLDSELAQGELQEAHLPVTGSRGRQLELRACVFPPLAGQVHLVVRAREPLTATLAELGAGEDLASIVTAAVQAGAVVVVGGTSGSGKDTTARALAAAYTGPGEVVLRSLRSRVDYDQACQMARAGLPVIATMHASDPRRALARLGTLVDDDGVRPVRAVICQRLVHRACGVCSPGDTEGGETCPGCDGRGVRGRIAVFGAAAVSEDGTVTDLVTMEDSESRLAREGLIPTPR